jgi:hypothetical protein
MGRIGLDDEVEEHLEAILSAIENCDELIEQKVKVPF